MKPYTIEVQRSVLKEIAILPQSVLARIQKTIAQLAIHPVPRGAQQIRGYKGYYRIRIGSYRIIYHVEKKIRIITIVKIGDRKDIYKKLR